MDSCLHARDRSTKVSWILVRPTPFHDPTGIVPRFSPCGGFPETPHAFLIKSIFFPCDFPRVSPVGPRRCVRECRTRGLVQKFSRSWVFCSSGREGNDSETQDVSCVISWLFCGQAPDISILFSPMGEGRGWRELQRFTPSGQREFQRFFPLLCRLSSRPLLPSGRALKGSIELTISVFNG